jgi:uncharacterized repeat protein (TIGR01451 family)
MRIAVLSLVALALSPSLGAAPLQLQLARPAVVRNLPQASTPAQDSGSLRLEFDSGFGRQELQLRPNRTLGVLATRVRGQAQAYRGTVAGQPGSWAALTRIGTRWTGVWFDGAHYFGVDDARNLAPMSRDAARMAPESQLVFRLSDLQIQDASLENDTLIPDAAQMLRLVEEELADPERAEAIMAAATLATKRLSVALIADAELAAQDGAQTDVNMLARLNIVDGIFSSQVGVHLQSSSVTVLTAGNQPFSTTDSSDLLEQLRDYRFGSAQQRAAGLSHLFTGRDLDGRTIGIAYLSGLCDQRFSASLSEAANRSTQFSALVAAHEIGHVFGAPHDGESGSVCEATPPNFLMAATLNQSSTFSTCSIEQITPLLTRSCLAPLDAADGTVEAPAEVAVPLGVATDVVVAVRSVGNAPLSNATLRITAPASVTLVSAAADIGVCSITGQVADCALGTLAPEALRGITLRVLAAAAGTPTLQLRLFADNDGLASNDSRSLRLRVASGTDMAVGATLDAGTVTVGTAVTAVITLENRGPVDVTDARVVVTLSSGLVLQQQTAEGITCAPVSAGLTCGPQPMAAGTTARVTLTLRPDITGTFTFSAQASASAPELQPVDNELQRTVQSNAVPPVTPPPTPGTTAGSGGGGGGGAASALWLMLLAVMTTARGMARRARPQRVAAAK